MAPDYVIAFGPVHALVETRVQFPEGARYERVAEIETFWQSTYRPELFWRDFAPVVMYDPAREGIYIYRRAPGSAR